MVSYTAVLSILAVATTPLVTALALPQIVDDSYVCDQWWFNGCSKLCLDGVPNTDNWCQTLQIDPQAGRIIKRDAQGSVADLCAGGDIVYNGVTYPIDRLCGRSIEEVHAWINATTPFYVTEF